MKERRSAYLRKDLQSRWATWSLLGGTVFFLIEGTASGSWRLIVGGTAVTVAVVLLIAHWRAGRHAATDLFTELAAELGLEYKPRNSYVPITPLLAAGERQRFTHTMEGPLFGALGGPPCLLGLFTYEDQHDVGAVLGHLNELGEDAAVYRPHRFTVCAIDIGSPIWRFRGLYLRPRRSGIGLESNWLDRAPKPESIKLESTRFNELYDLRRANDQHENAVRELFSPSFVVWLNEHPLPLGFECKAGTLAVYIHGHEGSEGKIRLLHEAAREIARRLAQQVEQGGGTPKPVDAPTYS